MVGFDALCRHAQPFDVGILDGKWLKTRVSGMDFVQGTASMQLKGVESATIQIVRQAEIVQKYETALFLASLSDLLQAN